MLAVLYWTFAMRFTEGLLSLSPLVAAIICLAALVPDGELARVEREVRVVSLKNEGGAQTLVRYVADAPLLRDSEMAEPRLEDLYLWLFKDERRQEDV